MRDLRGLVRGRGFSHDLAAFILAFYGFLYRSEFTYPKVHSFCPQFDLGTDCVSFYPSLVCPQHIVVMLKSSKTDFSRRGQLVVIAKAPGTVCAVSAIQQFFLTMRPSRGPLFSFRSGQLLTHSAVICPLQDTARCAGLPYHSLKGHSFCIRAASTTAAAGLPDWLMKVLGRWSSDCYQLYIRTPQPALLSASACMAGVLSADSLAQIVTSVSFLSYTVSVNGLGGYMLPMY